MLTLLLATAAMAEPLKADYASNLIQVEFSTPPKVTIELKYGRYAHGTVNERVSLVCVDTGAAWHCPLPAGIHSDEFDEIVIVPEEKMLIAVKTDASGTRTVHPVVRPTYPDDVPMSDGEMLGVFSVDFNSFLSCTGPGCGPPPEPEPSPPPKRRRQR